MSHLPDPKFSSPKIIANAGKTLDENRPASPQRTPVVTACALQHNYKRRYIEMRFSTQYVHNAETY